MEKVTNKSTSKYQCSTSKTVSSNSYFIILSIHNDTTYDKFRNTTYEVYVPSTDNEWEDYTKKYGEEYHNIKHNRFIKQALKQHVKKLNEILFRT